MSKNSGKGSSGNESLGWAKKAKKDEFYTQLADIENELRHYRSHLKDKVVYCNCDDPRVSKFFHFFFFQFAFLGLKKLIATCYKSRNPDLFSRNDAEEAIYIEYKREGKGELVPYPDYMQSIAHQQLYHNESNPNMPWPDDLGIGRLQGDGDFRSPECVAMLKQADIVVTNPPFSLFREYVAQLVEHDKKFLIIGNKNALTYKEIFKLIKENRLWIGNTPMGADLLFDVPAEYAEEMLSSKKEGSSYRVVNGVVKGRSQAVWFTNMDYKKRHEDLILYRRYSPADYPAYDNYDAIEVSETSNIPADYAGVMGVPVTFLDKHNPDQFEILGKTNSREHAGDYLRGEDPTAMIKGKKLYHRILIRNRKVESHENRT